MKSVMPMTILLVVLASATFAEGVSNVARGKELYLGEKFKCHSCHGKGGEGGSGPSFKGIGRKYSADEILQRAAHRCPPAGQCNPEEIKAIVGYLRTL